MMGKLIDRLVPDGTKQTRERSGKAAGMVGIAINTMLFGIKLLVGLFTASVAVTADAFNSLSDAGTSAVTLVGFRLAGQKADEEHPFGHGRWEYLTGLLVALVILLMGVELARTSVAKIIHPTQTAFSVPACIVLAVTAAAKLWLYCFQRALGVRIESVSLRAAATDSLADAGATMLVLVGGLLSQRLDWNVDGCLGVLVALFILKAGWTAVKETIDPLLGRPMRREVAEDIARLVQDHPFILGVHDMVYHDYGAGRAMMSFHAEVPADADLLAVHDVIDHIERELKERNGIETVIHMDPVVQDERTRVLRAQVAELAAGIHPALTIHDFRTIESPVHTRLLFDVVAPYGCAMTDGQLQEELAGRIRSLSDQYYPVIQVDRPFVTGNADS